MYLSLRLLGAPWLSATAGALATQAVRFQCESVGQLKRRKQADPAERHAASEPALEPTGHDDGVSLRRTATSEVDREIIRESMNAPLLTRQHELDLARRWRQQATSRRCTS